MWFNKTKTKFVYLDEVKAYYFAPQFDMEFGKHIENLRIILNGGDMWFEGEEAKELYNIILEKLEKEMKFIK